MGLGREDRIGYAHDDNCCRGGDGSAYNKISGRFDKKDVFMGVIGLCGLAMMSTRIIGIDSFFHAGGSVPALCGGQRLLLAAYAVHDI